MVFSFLQCDDYATANWGRLFAEHFGSLSTIAPDNRI